MGFLLLFTTFVNFNKGNHIFYIVTITLTFNASNSSSIVPANFFSNIDIWKTELFSFYYTTIISEISQYSTHKLRVSFDLG